MRLFLRTFSILRLLWLGLCLAGLQLVASGQDLPSKKAEEPRTAKLAVRDLRGTQYVYLTEAADAIGGIPAVSPLTKTATLVRGRTQARLAVGVARVLIGEQLLFLKTPLAEDAEGHILFPLSDLQVFCGAITGSSFEVAPGPAGTVYLKSLSVRETEPTPPFSARTPEALTKDSSENAAREQTALRREPAQPRRPNFAQMVIVIDPGHGSSRDTGVQAKSGLEERAVTLDVAERLKTTLESRLKVKVVLTRTKDYYLSADDRAERANQANDGKPADLLVSLHANASFDPKVKGICVYSMAPASKQSSTASVATNTESKIDLTSPRRTSLNVAQPLLSAPWGNPKRGDSDESGSAAPERLWDNLQQTYAAQSAELALEIDREISSKLNVDNHVVGDAPLRLLGSLAMPAVQVEIGYLSNSVEESFLGSSAYQQRCAEGIFSGIARYYLGTAADEVAP